MHISTQSDFVVALTFCLQKADLLINSCHFFKLFSLFFWCLYFIHINCVLLGSYDILNQLTILISHTFWQFFTVAASPSCARSGFSCASPLPSSPPPPPNSLSTRKNTKQNLLANHYCMRWTIIEACYFSAAEAEKFVDVCPLHVCRQENSSNSSYLILKLFTQNKLTNHESPLLTDRG